VSKLPRVSGRECVRALAKVGFSLRRQELDRGTLRAILRQAVIEVSEFIALL